MSLVFGIAALRASGSWLLGRVLVPLSLFRSGHSAEVLQLLCATSTYLELLNDILPMSSTIVVSFATV